MQDYGLGLLPKGFQFCQNLTVDARAQCGQTRMRQAPGGARRRRRRSAFESIQINSNAPFLFFRWFKPFKCGSNRVPSDAVKSVMMGFSSGPLPLP